MALRGGGLEEKVREKAKGKAKVRGRTEAQVVTAEITHKDVDRPGGESLHPARRNLV